ncbi:restriction endonuclease subunit S [Aneurinibacillus aneurinilyticus]|uniref:Restriction endonuclease subunit S n=1 Tax=Aneurinibacillus aneurinilyticus TaxID=1391 RepID=A0A848D0B6_ANEAE|nr:restriction endonuclease subunit S [Aneurinibacillus aneurinilyticus]NME99236.1 restriction endonuclease subunit S [Aneurinibacillus aneurinilyticus]
MTEQTNLVPKRRFKEFQNTQAWEQRKLGELAEKVSVGIATSSSEYFTDREKGVPFIKNQNIKQNRIDDSELEFISKDFDQANSTKRVKTGDVLTVRTGYPGLSAVVPMHLNGAQTFTTLITRLKKNKALPEFVSIFINSDVGMKQITGMEAGGAQKNVNAGTLRNLTVSLPSLDEQKVISKFVSQFDKMIALHQRKLEKTKALKSAYLSEMFPAEGEREPKRRFAGFTHAWEQRKLGEVADIIGGGTPSTSNEEYWDGNIDWYSPVEIGEQTYVDSSQKKITELGLQKSSAKILPIGTVLFTSRAGIGNTAILAKEAATNQGFQSIVPHKDELDSYFIYSRTHELQRYGETNGAGSTFVEVSGKQMAKMPMLIPTLEEQKKIGGFFERLDHLITLHQRKLEKLQNIKKAYLNEMFV